MTTIKDIRAKYPQYANRTDRELADALHGRFYADRMEIEEFYGKIGFDPAAEKPAPAMPTGDDPEPLVRPQQFVPLALPGAATTPTQVARPDPLTSAMMPDQAPVRGVAPIPAAPPMPRAEDDPRPEPGMMGATTEEQRRWLLREIARREAAAGGDPLLAAISPQGGAEDDEGLPDEPRREADPFPRDGSPRDQGLWQRREARRIAHEKSIAAGGPPVLTYVEPDGPLTQRTEDFPPSRTPRDASLMDQAIMAAMANRPPPQTPGYQPPEPEYDPLLRALGAEIGNVPERIKRGIAGNALQSAERGSNLALHEIGRLKRAPGRLEALYAERERMQDAGVATERIDREIKLYEQYTPEEIARRDAGLRDDVGTYQERRRDAQGRIDAAEAGMTPTQPRPGLQEAIVTGVASLGDMAPGVVGSLVTRNPLPMLAWMTGHSRGSTYADKRGEGYDSRKATDAANLYAAAEAVPEMVPLARLLKRGIGPFAKIAGVSLTEGASEVVTSGLQSLIDMGVLDESMTWGEAIAEAEKAGAAGMVMGAVTGGAGVAADKVSDRIRGREAARGTPADPNAVARPVDPLFAAIAPAAPEPPAPPVAPVATESLSPSTESPAPSTESPAPSTESPAPPAAPVPQAAPPVPAGDPDAMGDITEAEVAAAPERYEVIEADDGEGTATAGRVAVDTETGRVLRIAPQKAAGGDPAGGSQPQAERAPGGVGTGPGATPAAGSEQGKPADGAERAPVRKFLSHEETLAVKTDAKTFQYKGNADTEGVTDTLRNVTRYDPNRAGQLVLWERRDGTRFAADGHQRTGLARRSAEAGQADVGGTAAVIYREADGFTADEVMTQAALKNIGEGSGSAVDAARILRSSKETVADLGLPPNSALVRTADGLRRLSPDAFGMVANGVASERDGDAVGRNVSDTALQTDILALLTREKPENALQAAMMARDAASNATTETQTDMFGTVEAAKSLYKQRAQVLDAALKALGSKLRAFRSAVDNAEALEGAGNRLDAKSNAAEVDDASRIRQYLTAQANMKGPISDALSAAARAVSEGQPVAGQARAFVRDVQRSLEGSGPQGEAAPDGRSRDEAPRTPEPAPQLERGDDLLSAMMPVQTGKSPEQTRAEAEAKAKAQQSKLRKPGGNSGDAGPLFNPQDDLLSAKATVAPPKALPSQSDGNADAMPADAPVRPDSASFDADKWNKDRGDRIKASKAGGARHLDDIEPSVETMRGLRVQSVHDPKERGTVRTVANRGDVVVNWDDAYSAEKNLAEKIKDGKKDVWQSWLAPTDLKDYAVVGGKTVQAPGRPEPAKRAPTPGILSALSEDKQARAAELKARLAAKARTQTSSGLDPEYITLGAELVALYIEAGTKRFAQMLADFAETTGLTVRQAQEPMRAAYNQVRDTMDLAGDDVSGMDDAKAVLAEVRRALAAEASKKGGSDAISEPGTASGGGDVSGPGSDLERNRGDAGSGDGVGTADVPASGRGTGQGAGARGGAAGGDTGQRQAGGGVPGSDASAVGTGSDPGIPGRAGAAGQPADDRDGAGGGDRGVERLRPDDGRTADTRKSAADAPGGLKDRAEAQAKADAKVKREGVKPADEASIRASLPLLLPEQQDDVLKVERRFAKPDGHGMLLTNGTGTGKTYSGGGVIKRFAQAGKTDVLVVAPSQGILDHWQAALGDLGLDTHRLGGTADGGRGITLTTYANLGENAALAHRTFDLVVADEAQHLSSNKSGDATSALRALRALTNRPADLWWKSDLRHRAEWDALAKMRDGDRKTAEAHRLFKRREAEVAALAKAPRSKALFLSATPFAYVVNTDYAEGYLFEYPKDGNVGKSQQSGQNLFMVENFGFRIRYHKLTKPEAAVDTGVFEREFHERLRREGALSGRALDIATDYDRRFVKIESAIGEKIDAILKHISEGQRSTDKALSDGYGKIAQYMNRHFDYLKRMQLLEAIKAEAVIPDMEKHLALGRKVVVFHDFNVGGGTNPFAAVGASDDANLAAALADLHIAHPDVESMKFGHLKPPVEALSKAFGKQARVYNGTVSQKDRAAAKTAFNADGSGVDVIIVQSAAGETGISLHDTTGKHQRVLINLGMPVRPTTALQEEGRTRRVGVVSNAPYRYYTTGTTWERQAFAGKIAENSGTVENLALGNEARQVRDGFIDAYVEADVFPPGPDDGTGGKAKDRRAALTSPYDAAKAHYFGRMKTTGRRDSREGIDFFPTPEPLGFKMVEWAGIRQYERVLEPSAGDGAIARYFPADADRTIVEPSLDLNSRAQLRTPGARALTETFEHHHIVNKYDAIVMNPPFGQGGKTAFEHLAKAMRHLKDRGRIVALVPTGPSADNRWTSLWESDQTKDFVLTADVALPAVAFEKAGTAVRARILVLDRIKDATERQAFSSDKRINLTAPESIGTFFDRLEGISVPSRPDRTTDAAEALMVDPLPEVPGPALVAAGPSGFKTAEIKHGKTGDDLFVATARERVEPDTFKAMKDTAGRHGGWYSSFRGGGAVPGFQFPTEAQRQAFMDDMAKPTVGRASPDFGAAAQVMFRRETAAHGVAADEEIARLMPELRAELDRLDLKRVRLAQDTGATWQGAFHVTGDGAMEIVIAASLDPMATLHHEVIHALRAMNLFTPAEWKALDLAARRSWYKKHRIKERYSSHSGVDAPMHYMLTADQEIEEAIAEEFSEAMATKKAPPGGLLVTAFNKIARFLKALRNLLNGAGFQTVEDIFGRAIAGDISARQPKVTEASSKRQTPRDQTDTPAFKAWFGDSKVVDSEGKPLVVYHGTQGDVAAFDPVRFGENDDGWYGRGVYLTASKSMAEAYAGWSEVDGSAPNGGNVMPVYLAIQNPYFYPSDKAIPSLSEGSVEFTERLKEQGYDGVFVQNPHSEGDESKFFEIVAFRPEQIKSVFNRGTFDPADPRIRYQTARLPSRQSRAHMATAMGGRQAFIPDRRIWEELTRGGANIWARLRGGAAAAKDATDRARIVFQDRFLPVLRAQQAVERASGAPLPLDQNAYLSETTFSGKVGRHLFEIDEDFTKPIIDLIAGAKGALSIEDVGAWLYARHATERNAQIASINPSMPDGGSGMTDAEAQLVLTQAAAGPHAARLNAIGAKIDALRERTLKLREDAGLITNAEAQTWRTQYKSYVPLKGFADTDHGEAVLDVAGVGRRYSTRGPETQRALGRGSEAFNPLQAAITQAKEVAVRAEKNRVGQALYEVAKAHPSKALWEVKTPKTKRVYNRTTGLVETRVEDPVTLFMDPNEMAVKVSGVEHRITFYDPRLARAAGTVGADQMGAFMRMMSVAARWFSMARTMLNPEFMLTNAFRDMQTAQINIRGFGDKDRNALAAAMVKNWRKAFVGAWRGQGNKADTEWTRYYREFERAGAKVSFWTLEQPEAGVDDMKRRVSLKTGRAAWRAVKHLSPSALFSIRDNPVVSFIERTNMAVDNAIRLAAFVEARKKGWTETEAAALAKNLTVNFNRRGEAGATMNALWPFFNAAVQGSTILLQAMKSRRVAKVVLFLVAAGVVNDLVNAYLSEEDDDGELAYDKVPDYRNQRNIHLMMWKGNDDPLAVPMPYGYNVFPYMGQQIGKVYRGVKPWDEALGDFGAAVFGAFSPVQGGDAAAFVTPTILDPVLEMSRNENWLGRPIRPENQYADLGPDAYKYYASASELSKWLAETANEWTGGSIAERGAIDVSPEYIDHAFGFIVGSAGQFWGRSVDIVAKAASGNFDDIERRDVPFLRTLSTPTDEWLDRDRFYQFGLEVREANEARETLIANKMRVPRDIARMARLYDDLLAANRELKGQGVWNQSKAGARSQRPAAKVMLDFNRKFLGVAGPQAE
jgi:hypothetical protein